MRELCSAVATSTIAVLEEIGIVANCSTQMLTNLGRVV